MGLDGSACLKRLPVGTCNFESPDHVSRFSARAYPCAVVFGRAPSVPRSLEHRKKPYGRKIKKVNVRTKHDCT